MKNKLKTIGRTVLLVLVAAIVGINVYTLNAASLAGDAVPMPFGVGAAVVLSGSMEPELSEGDLLFIAERESYGVGDVVVFQDGRMAVTHCIVSIDGETAVTRGDANNADDQPINVSQIKGEVVAAIPLVGFVVNAVKTPVGTLGIIALALLLLERSFRAEKQKDEAELAAIRAEIEKLKEQSK